MNTFKGGCASGAVRYNQRLIPNFHFTANVGIAKKSLAQGTRLNSLCPWKPFPSLVNSSFMI